MKLAIGLVVKGGKQFIDKWIKSIENLADVIFVVDNNADVEVKEKLINHHLVKRYYIQKDMDRNMSRDYQIILDMAREEECDWVWNIDIDEEIVLGKYNRDAVLHFFLNCEFNSIGFPIFEMRNDENHFVMVYDTDKEMKEGRLVHKCYKVLSHFEFDKKDKHGQSIPHNCERAKKFVPLPIKHYGHMLKKQRDDKRKIYEGNKFKDMSELNATWMKEEGEDVIVKEFDEIVYKFQEGNWK